MADVSIVTHALLIGRDDQSCGSIFTELHLVFIPETILSYVPFSSTLIIRLHYLSPRYLSISAAHAFAFFLTLSMPSFKNHITTRFIWSETL